MRLKINAVSLTKNTRIPVEYNGYIKTFISGLFEGNSDELLEERKEYGSSLLGMYTFSRLSSKGIKYNKPYLEIQNSINFQASFYLSKMHEMAVKSICSNPKIFLGDQEFKITKTEFEDGPYKFQKKMKIKMLSPVVAYKTEYVDRKRKTKYYYPFDNNFSHIVRGNLAKKFCCIKGINEIKNFDFGISAGSFDQEKDFVITKVNNIIIKGYLGTYFLSGDPEILQVAYNWGLGAKNPEGFGMFEVLE